MSNLDGAIKNLWTRFQANTPDEFNVSTDSPDYVIAGLINKIVSHSEIIIELVPRGKWSEAVVLLRSAYEALVIMHYLLKHPEKIDDYKLHGLLVQYKDKLVSFHAGNFHNNQKARRGLASDKQEIIDSKILHKGFFNPKKKKDYKHLFRDGTILDHPDELSESINTYFTSFRGMRKQLLEALPDTYEALDEIGLMTYNVGSQVSHAHWHTVVQYCIGLDAEAKPVKPLVTGPFIFAGLIVMLIYVIHAYDERKFTNGLYKELEKDLEYAGKEALAACRQDAPLIQNNLIHPVKELPKKMPPHPQGTRGLGTIR